MDAKLLATIIAIAKKESESQAHDVTLLEQKVEAKLKEFHSKSPILETPDFYIKGGELFCKWQSGLTLSFGSVVGPQGLKGDKGDRGLTGPAGTDGVNGKNGLDGSNGRDGVDGKNGKDGKDGLDGKDGRTGPQGVRGAKGPVGLRGEQGKDGKDGERGPQGLPGLDGQDGEDGVGIEKAWVNDNYHLTIRLTSGKVVDAGYVRGPAGISAGKGGRVTGSYIGGGGSGGGGGLPPGSFGITGTRTNDAGELVIVCNGGKEFNTGFISSVDLKNPSFTYTSGALTSVAYTGGHTKVLTYNGDGTLNTLVTTVDGQAVTKTFSYNVDGSLASIAES